MLQGAQKVVGDLYDPFGHGSAMAGVAAGNRTTHPWAGEMLGIAPDAQIVSIRILDKNGNGSIRGLARGIRRAIKTRAPVISISAGIDFGECRDSTCPVAKAVNEANKKGRLVFAATGNAGGEPGSMACPGKHPGTISVGAEKFTGEPSSFSGIRKDGFDGDIRAAGGSIDVVIPGIEQEWILVPTSFRSVIWEEVGGGPDPLFDDMGDEWVAMMGSSPSTQVAAAEALLRLQGGSEASDWRPESPEEIFTDWTGRDMYTLEPIRKQRPIALGPEVEVAPHQMWTSTIRQ